ncbi:hypothetical protein Plhal703r1_c39g0136511 [Plasmopara halstedii]
MASVQSTWLYPIMAASCTVWVDLVPLNPLMTSPPWMLRRTFGMELLFTTLDSLRAENIATLRLRSFTLTTLLLWILALPRSSVKINTARFLSPQTTQFTFWAAGSSILTLDSFIRRYTLCYLSIVQYKLIVPSEDQFVNPPNTSRPSKLRVKVKSRCVHVALSIRERRLRIFFLLSAVSTIRDFIALTTITETMKLQVVCDNSAHKRKELRQDRYKSIIPAFARNHGTSATRAVDPVTDDP